MQRLENRNLAFLANPSTCDADGQRPSVSSIRSKRPTVPQRIRTIRFVAFGCELVLLLVGGPLRFLFSRRSIAFEPVRARQHHGLHTHPLEPVPYPRGFRAIAYHDARLVARAGGVVADGCADALLLCDGGRNRGGANGRDKLYIGAAQPRRLASPVLAGALYSLSWPAAPLIVCGALKIVYALLPLTQCRHMKPPEES